MSYANKVVWVTGASSGIGKALALEFSRYGAKVVLSSRNQDELEKVRQDCVWPDHHLVLPLDLARPADFPSALEQVVARYGRVDVLVNNGGISQRSLIADTSLEVDKQLMDINYFGTVALTKTVLPVMKQQGAGQIAVVTSLVGMISTPLRSSYAASKHALHGFFETLRAEEYHNGIRVSIIAPGFIRTNVSINALTGDGSRQGTMDAAQERGMSPEECADRIMDGLQRKRDLIMVAGREKLGVWLFRFLPKVFRILIRKVKVT